MLCAEHNPTTGDFIRVVVLPAKINGVWIRPPGDVDFLRSHNIYPVQEPVPPDNEMFWGDAIYTLDSAQQFSVKSYTNQGTQAQYEAWLKQDHAVKWLANAEYGADLTEAVQEYKSMLLTLNTAGVSIPVNFATGMDRITYADIKTLRDGIEARYNDATAAKIQARMGETWSVMADLCRGRNRLFSMWPYLRDNVA